MKKIYLLWSLAIATLMVNVFYACKSDDTLEEFYRKHGLTLNPTQDPDFVIYSNGNVLATTLGTRSEFGTRGESDDVLAYLAGNPTFVDAPNYTSYTITQVYVDNTNETFKFSNWGQQTIAPADKGMHHLTINGTLPVFSNEYYSQSDNSTQGSQMLNNVTWTATLVNIIYKISGYEDRTATGAAKFVVVNGTYYLCLDFKIDDYYNGDGDYNDWIFKIAPAGDENQGGNDNQGGNENQGQ